MTLPNPNHFKQQPTGRATAPVINPVTHDNIMAQFSRNFWWQNDEVINHLEAHNLCPVQDENGKFPVTDIRRATCILESLSEAGFDDADYGFEEVDGLTRVEQAVLATCLGYEVAKEVFAKGAPGILGRPGTEADGKPRKGVDWDALFPVTDADGVEWYVVECETNPKTLDSVRGSIWFLRSKGRC